MPDTEKTVILVKAWPQPSQRYGETVCCAGVTPEGAWRRLFPVRFRHLSGDSQFRRWDIVEYKARLPRDDNRPESRRVEEQSLRIAGKMRDREKEGFFDKLFRPSVADAAERGESLTLIRPRSLEFRWKKKGARELEVEAARSRNANLQASLLDRELTKIEPCPYTLRIRFEDDSGQHFMTCGDWETAATFRKFTREKSEEAALAHLKDVYERQYWENGVALSLGTVKKRPNQWLLLGVIRLDETTQPQLI